MVDFNTIQRAVAIILRDNIDLRDVKCRRIVSEIAEMKLGRKLPPESVPRICRKIQNEMGKYLPETKDGRWDFEEQYFQYATQDKNEPLFPMEKVKNEKITL